MYGSVPPDGFAVSVLDCPRSIVGDAGVIEPPDKTAFTVIVFVMELNAKLPDDEPVSVASALNMNVPVALDCIENVLLPPLPNIRTFESPLCMAKWDTLYN